MYPAIIRFPLTVLFTSGKLYSGYEVAIIVHMLLSSLQNFFTTSTKSRLLTSNIDLNF